MCDASCIIFCAKNLVRDEIKGKRILEVGSHDVNGSVRSLIELWGEPAEYIGVDINKGPCVDIVCNAEDIVNRFGKESFDVVISTDLVEHTKDWRTVISNIKNACKPNGLIVVTTANAGFPYHGFPYDFWRYELADLKNIFADCEVLRVEEDAKLSEVYIKVRKPLNFTQKDLSNYELYSIVIGKKAMDVADKDFEKFKVRQDAKAKSKNMRKKVRNFFKSLVFSNAKIY